MIFMKRAPSRGNSSMRQGDPPVEEEIEPIEAGLLLLVRLASTPLIVLGIVVWAVAFVVAGSIRPASRIIAHGRPRGAGRRGRRATPVGAHDARSFPVREVHPDLGAPVDRGGPVTTARPRAREDSAQFE
jgi:hypothetical protein